MDITKQNRNKGSKMAVLWQISPLKTSVCTTEETFAYKAFTVNY